jgi:methyl-accepting chemotaxis protein
LYDANPQDLIDYVAGEVKDIAKGSIRVEGKIPGRLPSPCLEGISDALEPMRRRAEFIDSTVAEILSISSGMHQSVINIVDAGERLAQQSNRAGSIVANIVVALRRATNDAASSMSVLNNMLIDIKTSIESVPGKVFMQEIKQLDEHVTDVRQAIMNLSDSTPKITSIAKNVGGAASKINLLALNTAVHAGVDEEAIGDLFAADEIQQYAQRIAGMSRHLTEQGDVINAIITNVAAQIETIGHSIDALRPLDQDQCTAGKQIGANNVKLIERVRNVMAIIDHQFNAASDASSCFGVIQEAIVELSADVNDIMTRVEELERLLGKLKRPQ